MLLREEAGRFRPQLIVAHSDPAYVASVERSFRQRGWAVFTADSGPQARRLVRRLAPALVVLEANLPGESGWLTSAKLRQDRPASRVVLVSPGPTAFEEDFAAFLGATLVSRPDGAEPLLEMVRVRARRVS
jgi:DNA-binding response OmpR family regulator